jgi:Ca2+-binding RTX toxin-like protein
MSAVKTAPGVIIDPSVFWTATGKNVTGEGLVGLVGQVGNLLLGTGTSTSTFKELTFNVGDLTYHYLGNFKLDVNSILGIATTSASGSYSKVIVEKAGEFLASLKLDDALDVDLGTSTGLNLGKLGLGDLVDSVVGGTVGTLLDDVLGTVDDTVENLNTSVTPTLTKLVKGLIPTEPTVGPTPRADVLTGTSSSNTINALAGNDSVHGMGGNDKIHGDAGNDKIWGDTGNDRLYGDAGKDALYGGAGKDGLRGGTGNDTVSGGTGNDTAHGDKGNDKVMGNSGNDKLYGDAGNDKLYGNNGADHMTGGRGADMLFGGKQADTFVFRSTSDTTVAAKGRDTIMDFSHKQHDKIDLHVIDADKDTAGNQAFHFEGKHHFDGTDGDLIFRTKGHETFVLGDTNGDHKADFSIELHGSVHLLVSDFIL